MKTLRYETRDGKGNDIVREIPIKEFKTHATDCTCDICGGTMAEGVHLKDAVSSKFTDWAAFPSGVVCPVCAELFSVYPYSYIYSPKNGIQLMNVRQIRDRLTDLSSVSTPFMVALSTSQKKHLFYCSVLNSSTDRFAVNLETETIFTTCDRQRRLFDFVENLQGAGCSKEQLKAGEIRFDVLGVIGFDALHYLRYELEKSREIQIPLFCGQKRNEKEEAICNLVSILNGLNVESAH